MEQASGVSSLARTMIRVLTVEELPLVMPCAREYVKEQPQPGGFDEGRFLDFWRLMLSDFQGTILVAERDGELLGGISGYLIPDAYTTRILAQEGWFYVTPAHRHSTVGVDLFFDWLLWAMNTHADAYRVGSLEGPFAKGLELLFLRHGFRKIETHYEKEA